MGERRRARSNETTGDAAIGREGQRPPGKGMRGQVGGVGRWWLRGRTHRRGFTVSEV